MLDVSLADATAIGCAGNYIVSAVPCLVVAAGLATTPKTTVIFNERAAKLVAALFHHRRGVSSHERLNLGFAVCLGRRRSASGKKHRQHKCKRPDSAAGFQQCVVSHARSPVPMFR